MHTHFGSGTSFIMTGLNVLLFLTFWRLAWFHVARLTSSPMITALASAANFQAS